MESGTEGGRDLRSHLSTNNKSQHVSNEGGKHELNGDREQWLENSGELCISIFLLVKIFLKLHIADCCCCGVNLVSFVRPLQAEICSRHEFWWWQVVAASGGGGGVVQRLPLHHSPSHETRLGATTD